MTDYSYTTRDDAGWKHIALIDRGGFGEVHKLGTEMHNPFSGTSTTVLIARKLIRPFGQATKEDIEKEVEAVTKISATGGNENIINILRHGPLPSTDYYYIDMGLCDVNLADYLSKAYDRRLLLSSKELETAKRPVVIPSFPSPEIRAHSENVYTIMSHIVSGLAFLHRHRLAHRDLKPKNVLYSLAKNRWMLADFGITSHATTDQANPTMYARGTGGYRAPELLVVPAEFTNKVDIWALGCIFFELLSGGRRAFDDDFAVQTYRHSSSYPPMILLNPVYSLWRKIGESDNFLLSQMLSREPKKRPHINIFRNVFEARCTIMTSLCWSAALRSGITHPLFKDWETVLSKGLERHELLLRLASICEESGAEVSISLLKLVVSEAPFNESYRRRLRDLYAKGGISLDSLKFWENLVGTYPQNRKIFNELRSLAEDYYAARTAKDVALRLNDLGKDGRLVVLYMTIFARICGQENSWTRSADMLEFLVIRRPHDVDLAEQLRIACQNAFPNNSLEVIKIWRKVVSYHPREDTLIAHLRRALEEHGDDSVTMTTWRELVAEHPQVSLLQRQLRHILHEMCDSVQAIRVLAELNERFPENVALRDELRAMIRLRGIHFPIL